MRRVVFGLALSASLVPALAFADPPSDLERAKESFKAGATAYAAGDYLAAIQALDAAYQLTPLPAIAFSIGQAERRQYFVDHARAHLDRAIALFRRYVDLSPTGSRRADALDALSQLEPLAASLAQFGAPTPHAVEPARRTRVLITSDAPGARASFDGAPPASTPLIREVEPGKHRVLVEAPGFFRSQREVTAIAGELLPTPVALRERPSTLSIWTPAGADLYVDGDFLSAGGDGILVQLAGGEHRLVVAQKGHQAAVRNLALERGKAQTIRVELEQTPQRIASQALFIGGGAALGASLVASALAIRAEGQAEDFLRSRALGNVTTGDLIRYHSTITDRDRFRIGTTVCLAASAGFFITGLFLHVLDEPNAQLLYRAGPRSGQPPRRESAPHASVQVAPLVYESGFGAMVGGMF